ncbi:hypothetical protein VZT92_006388 [Zoarces viviparus]|uniref:Uncharacterized protein n=1 Tax=Zoarces viviparus TaxID=48416 RepID=A0AAW1FR63_ZOAVI
MAGSAPRFDAFVKGHVALQQSNRRPLCILRTQLTCSLFAQTPISSGELPVASWCRSAEVVSVRPNTVQQAGEEHDGGTVKTTAY